MMNASPEIKALAVALENCKESSQKLFIEKIYFTYFRKLAYNTLYKFRLGNTDFTNNHSFYI